MLIRPVCIVTLLLMAFILISPTSSFSDESWNKGYDYGHTVGRNHQKTGQPYDPYGALKKYVSEYYSFSGEYNRSRLEQGFIAGYEAGYRQRNLTNLPFEGIASFVCSLILIILVFRVILKKKRGIYYHTTNTSRNWGCVSFLFAGFLLFGLFIYVGRLESGWAFILAFVDALCLGFLTNHYYTKLGGI